MKNKEDLVKLVSRDTGYAKDDVRIVLNSFIKIIKRIVSEGNDLNISEFGKFSTDQISQQQYDLNSGLIKNISYKKIRFKISDKFKAEVNGKQ